MGYSVIGSGRSFRISSSMDPLKQAPEFNTAFREVATAILRKLKEDPGWVFSRVPRSKVAQRRLLEILATGAKDAELEALFGIPPSPRSSFRRCQRRNSCRSSDGRRQSQARSAQ